MKTFSFRLVNQTKLEEISIVQHQSPTSAGNECGGVSITQFLVRESSSITTLSNANTHLEHIIHHNFLPYTFYGFGTRIRRYIYHP